MVSRKVRDLNDPSLSLRQEIDALWDGLSAHESLVIAAVDPSIRSLGWAVGEIRKLRSGDYRAVIMRAGTCYEKPAYGLQSVRPMVEQLNEKIRLDGEAAKLLVFEHPVVYPTAKFNDPNDLFPLCAVLGGVMLTTESRLQWGFYPDQWKGQVPKDAHQKRHMHLFPAAWRDANLPDDNAIDAALILRFALCGVCKTIEFADSWR